MQQQQEEIDSKQKYKYKPMIEKQSDEAELLQMNNIKIKNIARFLLCELLFENQKFNSSLLINKTWLPKPINGFFYDSQQDNSNIFKKQKDDSNIKTFDKFKKPKEDDSDFILDGSDNEHDYDSEEYVSSCESHVEESSRNGDVNDNTVFDHDFVLFDNGNDLFGCKKNSKKLRSKSVCNINNNRGSCHQCKRKFSPKNLLYCWGKNKHFKSSISGKECNYSIRRHNSIRSCNKKYCLSCMQRY